MQQDTGDSAGELNFDVQSFMGTSLYTDESWIQSALSITQRTLRSLCERCGSLPDLRHSGGVVFFVTFQSHIELLT
jgi:hypothetical protein